VLFTVMSKRIKGLFDASFMNAVGKMASATGFMAVVTYISVAMMPLAAADQSFWATFPKFVAIVVISLSAYLLLGKLFGLREVRPVIDRIKKILFSRPRVS